MSLNGNSSDVGSTAASVGDFSMLLFNVNGQNYPNVWTRVVITLSGIPSPVTGRLAFRYRADGGGPDGSNSDYIGVDSVQYCCTSCGIPTPTPNPTPSPPGPTETPCSCGGLNVSGRVINCASTSRTAPVSNVSLTTDGTGTISPTNDGFYNYHMGFPGSGGGGVTITPSKPSVLPARRKSDQHRRCDCCSEAFSCGDATFWMSLNGC